MKRIEDKLTKGRVTEDDILIGDKIRSLRLAKKVTQTELADQLGVSCQQLQKYEKSTNRVAASRLLQIAKALKVDINYFYRIAELQDPDNRRNKKIDVLTELGLHQLGLNFLRLPTRQQQAIIQLIESLIKELE